MIPVEFTHFENFDADKHENYEADDLLNHLELHQIERATVDHRADPVGRNQCRILKQRHAPAG